MPGSADAGAEMPTPALPFLPLLRLESHHLSVQTLNSSRFVWIGHLTFRVMGGKNGKKTARSGMKRQHAAIGEWNDEHQDAGSWGS